MTGKGEESVILDRIVWKDLFALIFEQRMKMEGALEESKGRMVPQNSKCLAPGKEAEARMLT